MDLDDLKKKAKMKVLLRGESSTGKTYNSCRIVIELLKDEYRVLYIDTENEGSTTLINLIEESGLDEDIVGTLDYRQISEYDEFVDVLGEQSDYDLMVIDTLDHKHTMALKGVTDARMKSDVEWNEYAQIYSAEKEIMEDIGKPETNILATIDPDSGKMDKPKGAQTNVHGYFSVVIDLNKGGGEWGSKISNWVGRSDVIGNSPTNLVQGIADEIKERAKT